MVERYVNLGDCYDRAGLQPLRQELMGCMKGYKACYQRAYRCLGAAERLREEEGLSLRDAVRQAAKELGLSRNELYRLAVEQE